MIFGKIKIKDFLEKTKGQVRGRLLTDAKRRVYEADYTYREEGSFLWVSRQHKTVKSEPVKLPAQIELDESLVAFFGLYSGDGAKGSEEKTNTNIISPNIFFSQIE